MCVLLQNEQKQGGPITEPVKEPPAKEEEEEEVIEPVQIEPPAPAAPPKKEEDLDQKGLEELIRFINGTDEEQAKQKQSAKAAKRARQKQKKVSIGKATIKFGNHVTIPCHIQFLYMAICMPICKITLLYRKIPSSKSFCSF